MRKVKGEKKLGMGYLFFFGTRKGDQYAKRRVDLLTLRQGLAERGFIATKPVTLLMHHIPISTEWTKEIRPGYVEET